MRILSIRLLASTLLLSGAVWPAVAQKDPLPTDKPVQMVTPVFSEQVLFALPPTFQVMARDQVSANSYLREMPLRGETVLKWTQMVTLTGAKDMSLKPNGTVENVAAFFTRKYQGSCPDSFAAEPMQKGMISGKASAILLMGCGAVQDAGGRPGAMHSETALIVILQGAEDLYTVQWAERGPARGGPAKLNTALWLGRLKVMQPVKVCPLAAGTAGCLAQR